MTRKKKAKSNNGGSNRSTAILFIIAVILIGSIAAYYVFQPAQPKQSLQYITVEPTNSVPKIAPNIKTCQGCTKSVDFSFSVTSTLIKETTVSVHSVLIMNGTSQVGTPYQASSLQVYVNNTVQTKPTKINLNVPTVFDVQFNTTTSDWAYSTYNLAMNLVFGSPFSSNFTYTLKPETFTLINNLPSNVKSFVPITITNSQKNATTAPFQQMIQINNANYASVENADLSNVEFFDNNGNIIPSWLENGNSKAGMSTYWVSLKNGIPANTTIKIFMGFASLNSNLFNGVTIGEASQLSEFPGQYNNIGHVMDSGLLMQYYYSKNATVVDLKPHETQLYHAYMTNGTKLDFSYGDFNTTINPIATPQNVTPFYGYYILFGYQAGYGGATNWPTNAVPDTSHSWAIKTLGWVDMNTSTNFILDTDDGITASMTNNGPAFNGSTWLGGKVSPNNEINAWFQQGLTQYSFSHPSGTYRFESDYYEAGGGSYYLLATNQFANYYHASLPPNNAVPTNSFGTYSIV